MSDNICRSSIYFISKIDEVGNSVLYLTYVRFRTHSCMELKLLHQPNNDYQIDLFFSSSRQY
jgi:hypothetical protein